MGGLGRYVSVALLISVCGITATCSEKSLRRKIPESCNSRWSICS